MYLCVQSKLRSNPESAVGLMTLSELSVLVTLTTDSGKILAKLHAVQPQGSLNIVQGIKIAHVSKSHILQPVLTADTHPGLGITL